jgi:hypothetical protein
MVVGGGATVVATIAAAAGGATVDEAGVRAAIVVTAESVATDVVELAPTVAPEPSAAGPESEPHAATAQVTATMVAMKRVTRILMLPGTRPPPSANHG